MPSPSGYVPSFQGSQSGLQRRIVGHIHIIRHLGSNIHMHVFAFIEGCICFNDRFKN